MYSEKSLYKFSFIIMNMNINVYNHKLNYAKRVDNKYQSHTDNGILLYLTDDTTSNMTAWIPGRNTVAIINKYTIIKAHPSDFGFQENKNIIPSYTRFYHLSFVSSRGCQATKRPVSRGCQAQKCPISRGCPADKHPVSRV